ncbi:NUDIX hydrolase [Microvirga arsenatis]|uniref:NUDIX domain-containing protein n=1 Tax=Microvirga arsenatis TaxID=2692265 RepID=A0ABW9Z2Z4_9HYPH|nr:NUDIX hydrolase [Microvirga arsenatis]NBJ11380.1 NUDIX domain-containing protein [Microvirga arsenatis]NBJ25653.1 NUDIX domain-containing protein [Microvirga arsenatis]
MSRNRFYPDRPVLAASVAVIRDGRILLAARGKPPSEGLFSLPGGMVEVGESLSEAALRELREEVGVEAEIIGLIAPVEFIERDEKGHIKHHVVIAAHAARWVSGEPQTGPEAKEIRWVTERDIADLPMTAGLDSILEQAFGIARRDPAA